ncbi:UNVERIFIED_CONTAM: hypothetical protein HDU68_009965 [Siphonaria sp. JEL0065]|nr:hypothetical protein HDU68_009965 [Siphonaria sp. JEL0065]
MERVIIDCDVGIDDITVLLMCFKHPEIVKVEAVTIVDGNVDLPAAFQTAKLVTALAEKPQSEVPVIAGANGPLIRGVFQKVCYEGHGQDGLGNFTLRSNEWETFTKTHFPNYIPEPLATTLQTQIAAVELVKRVAESPGEITLLAIGPLTNVAIGLSLDPNFLRNLKSLVIMGGSTDAKGNTSRVAEFNFVCDPEAAHVVFQAASVLQPSDVPKVILVPWETTVDHAFPWTYFDELLERSSGKEEQSKFAAFLEGYISFTEKQSRNAAEEAKRSIDQKTAAHEHYFAQVMVLLLCDAYAAACILDPSSILEYRDFDAKIELGGTYSRGLVALNWHTNEKPNCRVVFKMDIEKIKRIFEKTFKS